MQGILEILKSDPLQNTKDNRKEGATSIDIAPAFL